MKTLPVYHTLPAWRSAAACFAALWLTAPNATPGATRFVDLNSAAPLPPYTNWSTAAQDIQSAVDVAVDGDIVIVTNGTYATGGRAIYGTMTNRVAIDRAITVQSVNGADVTTIRGAYAPGGTNGEGAVRCVYLTNGAALTGFTLTNGATHTVGPLGDREREASGGGALCAGASAMISKCVFTGNLANWGGGGAHRGTLSNCLLFRNTSLRPYTIYGGGQGGGVDGSTLVGCILTSNLSYQGGGAVYSTLINCALTNNTATDNGGGAAACTLTNCSLAGNFARNGGGVSGSTLQNCTLTRNLANGTYTGGGGGGAWTSALTNCLLQTNYATAGGGASACTLDQCTIATNSAEYGGGVSGGTSYRCTFTGNFVPLAAFAAGQGGGGAISAVLVSCRLIGNSAFDGGGSYYGTLTNCVLTANLARNGGGVFGGTLNGCTVAGNSADRGGGIMNSRATNCILYFNNATVTGSNYYYDTEIVLKLINYCCTAPIPNAGYANIVNEPAFVDYASGDFRLQSNSPCINSGNNAYVATTVDFGGNPRIGGGTVDIGAYEFQGTGSTMSYAWLQQFGLPTDGSADFADADGDGMSNYAEWSSDTNPTNAQSVLKMVSVARVANTVQVAWESVPTRNYTLEWAFGLNPSQFHQVGTIIPGKPGLTTITQFFMGLPPSGPTFYRVSAQR